ncbi:MAG: DUF166 domain-containing protein [Proteobacteria bacterium]|nr:hypothetical protein [Desulfobulbaceae bacterium]MBU4154288.1 DUF166 domain-containing protein [Pseudomonadota bacterium]
MNNTRPTRIVIFEYRGSGKKKIEGILRYGHDIEITATFNITEPLSGFIDDPERYISSDFDADLVLCFIKHPDLDHYLADVCQAKGIAMIASGCKLDNAITPFTCCGLGKTDKLGAYGEQFGVPEFEITMREDGRIAGLTVKRGASCGATWEVTDKVIGMPPEEALPTLAREVQYLCIADPSAFDPISGHSALHYAGEVHIAALKKALAAAQSL